MKIQDIVRVTVKALGNPADIEDHVLLWQAMVMIGERQGVSQNVVTNAGRLGMLVQVSAWQVAEGLFFDEKNSDAIQRVLTDASRAGLVKMRSRNPYTFWVALKQEQQPTSARSEALTRAERRLTKAEAGEDRVPEPVTVTKAPTATPSKGGKGSKGVAPLTRDTGTPVHELPQFQEARAREWEKRRQESQAAVLDTLAEHGPLQLEGIAQAQKKAHADESTRNAVFALMEADLVRSIDRGGQTWYFLADQPTPNPADLLTHRKREYQASLAAAVREADKRGIRKITPKDVAEILGIKPHAALREGLREAAARGLIRQTKGDGDPRAYCEFAPLRRRRAAPVPVAVESAMLREAEASVAMSHGDPQTYALDEVTMPPEVAAIDPLVALAPPEIQAEIQAQMQAAAAAVGTGTLAREEAARLRAENDNLRAENERLKAKVNGLLAALGEA